MLSRSTFEATEKVVCASLLKDSILVYLRSCLGSDFALQFFPVPSPLLFTCFNGTIRQRARFENFETAPFLKVRPGQTIHVSLALHDWCPASVEACIGAILFFRLFIFLRLVSFSCFFCISRRLCLLNYHIFFLWWSVGVGEQLDTSSCVFVHAYPSNERQ